MGKRTSNDKIIEIVAGPNGSGKTTFAESYLFRIKQNLVFLNPDIIASGIGPLDFEKASFQAGRLLISEIKSRIERGENFAFESTLSGRSWAHLLSDAKKTGYKIVIYFLFLDSIDKNLKRIKTRVRLGGHNIPKAAVLRRQPRCFENFWRLYRPLAEDWYIFNNSKKKPDLVVSRSDFDLMPADRRDQFASDFIHGKFYGHKGK